MIKNPSIQFLGAAREVGRSGFLIDAGDKLLLDYGVKFGQNNQIVEPLRPKTNLDAIILSHAHLDHSGNIPKLFTDSNSLTYLTPPTLELSNLLWEDSLKIAGHNGVHAGFSRDELHRIHRYSFPVGYKRKLHITQDATLEFLDAGHILGSAMPKLTFGKNKTLLYTGDFNPMETRLHNGADLKAGKIDSLIIESTYGNRNHPPRKELEKVFAEGVQDIIDRDGWALIPCFAIGRGQEVIDILRSYNVEGDIFYDGMGQKAAHIMLNHPDYLRDSKHLKKSLKSAFFVRSIRDRKKALKKPCIIVSSAGMMQGGPILFYTRKLRLDSNSKMFFTGYQADGTIGKKLLDTKKFVEEKTQLDVGFEVEKYDFSAHAQKDGMLKAIDKWNPEKIFLVHGDEEIMFFFKDCIKEMGFKNVEMPKQGQTMKLF
ncbi:MBL fold metallo-hydrolase [Candidatus Micrarchaeota archaeon]|nr:MBL fold metallo-hydrolase [Candidatus Micrarchaeota archaeon]MBU1930297.1 MBL fold metallo-hydrolase [Candidatus Micrarchaeota archaeon]